MWHHWKELKSDSTLTNSDSFQVASFVFSPDPTKWSPSRTSLTAYIRLVGAYQRWPWQGNEVKVAWFCLLRGRCDFVHTEIRGFILFIFLCLRKHHPLLIVILGPHNCYYTLSMNISVWHGNMAGRFSPASLHLQRITSPKGKLCPKHRSMGSKWPMGSLYVLLNKKQELDTGKQNRPTSSVYRHSVYTRSDNELSIKISFYCTQKIWLPGILIVVKTILNKSQYFPSLRASVFSQHVIFHALIKDIPKYHTNSTFSRFKTWLPLAAGEEEEKAMTFFGGPT